MLLYFRIDRAILVSGTVVLAECDQRLEFKAQILDSLWMVVLSQLVLHDRAVFAVNHKHGLLDFNSFDFVSENRKRIKTELFQIPKTLGMNDTGIAVGGKIKRLALDKERLFQLGKHDNPPHRRLRCGDQQTVVAPSIEPDNCGRGKAAAPVRLEPLSAESGIHITAHVFIKLNHESPPQCSFGKTQFRAGSDKKNGAYFGMPRPCFNHS